MPEVSLREIEDRDADAIFEQMRDPEAVRMAAFAAADPSDRAAFDAHLSRNRAAPGTVMRAVLADGVFAGTISSFAIEGDTEVTYWIGRAFWGQGIAGRALELLLAEVPDRPIRARVAADNAGSLRVLQRAGFRITGEETAYATARGTEILEYALRLD